LGADPAGTFPAESGAEQRSEIAVSGCSLLQSEQSIHEPGLEPARVRKVAAIIEL
jgi:hypothetical protein